MKTLRMILIVMFIIGLAMTLVGFGLGLNLAALPNLFSRDDEYSEPLTYVDDVAVTKLVVDLSDRNIIVDFIEGDTVNFVYREHEHDTWTFTNTEGTLTIRQTTRPFSSWFQLRRASEAVLNTSLSIPKDWVIDIDLRSNVGKLDMQAEDTFVINTLEIDFKTGSVMLGNLAMASANLVMSTGSITLADITVAGDLSILTSTGRITLNDLEAADINLRSSTGRIELEDVTADALDARADTGRIKLNKVHIDGQVTLSTSTGDIVVEDTRASGFDITASTGSVDFSTTAITDYRFDLRTSVGSITVAGVNQGNRHATTTGTVLLKITVSTGSIHIIVQA
ncbi:MAG: hypothetical protein EA375_02540 [Acholeplasmataceae bacterium]|nr:MAG: hypothetical protein EA375_02540 [Acholeplasmataceae bacterium]